MVKKKPKYEKQWEKIYFNPKHPASFGGVDRLSSEISKPKRPNRKEKIKTEKFLENYETYTLHKPIRYNFARRRVLVGDIDEQWQCDLNDMKAIKKYNDGYCYILTVIDCFSKYAFARPVKTKQADQVAKAFEDILSMSNRKPLMLQSDKGK